MPITAAAMRMMKKFGLCGIGWLTVASSIIEYFATSFAPESAVVIMPNGLINFTAAIPTRTPPAMARPMKSGLLTLKASISVVETA